MCSWLPARVHARLELAEHLPDLLALCASPGLVLGRGAFGRETPFLGFAFATQSGLLLALRTRGRHAETELRYEAAGAGARDEPAQVRDRTAAHATHLQPAGKLVEQSLGVIAAGAKQHACCLALFLLWLAVWVLYPFLMILGVLYLLRVLFLFT